MVRPFDLRDVALVRRLSERGISLHAESALADNLRPVRDALVSMFVGGEFPTFVWKSDEADGFIQLRLTGSSPHAYVLYVSPGHEGNGSIASDAANLLGVANSVQTTVWLSLLDQAVAEAGQRGIHSVVAEVDENGPELILLRRAGFVVYTRQDIWVIRPESIRPPSFEPKVLSRRQPTDDWDIQLLYANTVPRLVQLVEPMPPLSEGENWVLREGNDLAASVHIHKGAVATWLRFFIHPDAESEAAQIVAGALTAAAPKAGTTIYCCVRRYESWGMGALEQRGFTHYGSQAVMVRHTVHHLPRAMPEPAAVLDGHRIPASTPMIRQYRSSEQNGKHGSI